MCKGLHCNIKIFALQPKEVLSEQKQTVITTGAYSIIINHTELQNYFRYIRYTAVGSESGFFSETVICAVLLDWPSNNTVMLGALSSTHVSKVEMLGLDGDTVYSHDINLRRFIFL